MGFLDPNSWANAMSDDPTGSKFAAQMQQQSAANAMGLQQQQYDYARQKMDPWVQAGQMKEQQLMQQTASGAKFDPNQGYTMQQFQNSPEYALQMQALNSSIGQQNQGIEAQAAASGAFGNPATQNALLQNAQKTFGQALPAAYQQGRGNWLNDYNMLVGMASPEPAKQVIDYGGQYANTMGNLGMYGANAIGAGQMGAQAGRSAASANLANSGGQLANYFAHQGGGYDPYAAAVSSGGADPYGPPASAAPVVDTTAYQDPGYGWG